MHRLPILLLLSTALGLHASVVSYSPPVGGMTISVPAGQTRTAAIPLHHASVGSGVMRGVVDTVADSYIEVNNAGWTPGALSSSSNPYYVRFLSGNAAGRMLPIASTANTSTRLNLLTEGVGLTGSGGPVAGDEFEIVLADTLGSLFGSNTLAGGADYLSADNVLVWNGSAWFTFYYNTTRSRWELSTDTAASPARDNYTIRSDAGVMIRNRGSSAIKMLITGRAPQANPKILLRTPGNSMICTGMPVPITLAQVNIGNLVGASDGTSANAAGDLVRVWNGSAWFSFYYNTLRSRWELTTDNASSPSRDGYQIPIDRPLFVRKIASASNSSERFARFTLPY